MDLSDLIERNAAFTPDKPATIFQGESLSYAAFNTRVAQTARALKCLAPLLSLAVVPHTVGGGLARLCILQAQNPIGSFATAR